MRYILLLALLGLSACSVYHPLSGGIGYTDTPVGPDTVQVAYVGPADMPMTQARDYALLRAAEITVLRNEPFFQIVAEQGYVTEGERYLPGEDFAYVGGWGGRHYRHAIVFQEYSPGYFEPYSIPEYTLTIRPTTQPDANAIPAGYLVQRAESRKIRLSAGVPERAAGMPTVAPAPPTTAP